MRIKRAQAALEFLTTYGWAFLVILIMIGTLAYFGILNPGKLLPNRCMFGTEFQCIDYQIAGSPSNTFRLKIKNNIGEAINIQSMTLSSEGVNSFTCQVAPDFSSPGPINPWKSGNTTDLIWSNCNPVQAGFSSGEKEKVLLTIRYYSVQSGSNYAKEVNGEIFSGVI